MTYRCLPAVALLAFVATVSAQQDIPVYAGRGAVPVHVPPGYVEGSPTPLVIAIHGYTSNARNLESYIQFKPLSDEKGFLLAEPNGLFNDEGDRYWNATDACCGGEGSDDSGYLRGLMAVIVQTFTVDPRRILVFGHSNGGFMAHRVGCDHADVVAAFVSFGGDNWDDPTKCTPAGPIYALEIHGTEDIQFDYDGGCNAGGCYPSAMATAQTWADLNHCAASQTSGLILDLTTTIPGPDTTSVTWSGCDAGGSSALWTVVDGPHHPALSPSFNDITVQYLLNHPKPSGIACDEVVGMHGHCGADGAFAIDVQLRDAAHDGTTIDVAVDGELHVAPVHGSRARVELAGRSTGLHVARLIDPAGCATEVEAVCRP
jgi:polyhydroxybutyrate depolymerase